MRKIIIVLIVVLLFGCEFKIESRENNDSSNYGIRIIHLEDGTKCAVFQIRGGISCDWSSNK